MAFCQARVSLPATSRRRLGSRAPCSTARLTPGLLTGIINAALRMMLSLLRRHQVGHCREEILLLSTHRGQGGSSVSTTIFFFLQLHQPNEPPRIFIRSGGFPDRYLVGDTWISFSEKAWGWGGSIASTGLGWCGAGSWLLNWDFPSVPNGNRKGSCPAIALFALCSGQPEKLFQNKLIRQKNFRKSRG